MPWVRLIQRWVLSDGDPEHKIYYFCALVPLTLALLHDSRPWSSPGWESSSCAATSPFLSTRLYPRYSFPLSSLFRLGLTSSRHWRIQWPCPSSYIWWDHPAQELLIGLTFFFPISDGISHEEDDLRRAHGQGSEEMAAGGEEEAHQLIARLRHNPPAERGGLPRSPAPPDEDHRARGWRHRRRLFEAAAAFGLFPLRHRGRQASPCRARQPHRGLLIS